LGELPPRRARMPAAGAAPFATAHRVIDGVHGDAAVVRSPPQPAGATRLAEAQVGVVDVGDLTDGRPAVEVHAPDLARGQPDLRPDGILGHQRRGRAGRAHQLTALALAELDVVDRRARGDEAQGQAVAGLDVGV